MFETIAPLRRYRNSPGESAMKPRIHLIATGGTIAGASPSATDTTDYRAGTLTIEALIASVPPLADLAELTTEQLYKLDSKDMTPRHWLGLARAIEAAVAQEHIDGVVITHGTDTLEESAFFADLVLTPDKPVVFTCAMRPATALSPDGPMNLYNAVSVACDPSAAGLGVLVVTNDRIHAAREVTKAHTQAVDAFISPDTGPLGWARPPLITHKPVRPIGHPVELQGISTLPRVDILFVTAGSSPDLLQACIAAGARGIVLALPGHASVPESWKGPIAQLRNKGYPVIETSRTGAGPLTMSTEMSRTPTKARIELMLELSISDRTPPLGKAS